jgi:curli biogenesis system outer membrane secretion channel CsgG
MRTVAVVGVCALLAGCTATVNKQGVRATDQAPEGAQVEVVRIPYDPSYPRYVVTIEPFTFDASGTAGGRGPQVPGRRYGWGPWGWGLLPEGPRAQAYTPPPQSATASMGSGIASQLETALSNVGNVQIIDYQHYLANQKNPGRMIRRGEIGPLVIRGSVTEFNEVAEATGSSTGASLGALGTALGIAGAIAGNTEAAVTGAAVAIANPTFEKTVARRTGKDVKIVNPRDGRLAASINANGSFTAETAASGFSVFGIGKASNAFAQSALGQANRAAMNSATQQIWDRLRSYR